MADRARDGLCAGVRATVCRVSDYGPPISWRCRRGGIPKPAAADVSRLGAHRQLAQLGTYPRLPRAFPERVVSQGPRMTRPRRLRRLNPVYWPTVAASRAHGRLNVQTGHRNARHRRRPSVDSAKTQETFNEWTASPTSRS